MALYEITLKNVDILWNQLNEEEKAAMEKIVRSGMPTLEQYIGRYPEPKPKGRR